MSSGFPNQPSPNPFSAPESAAPPPRRSATAWLIGIGCLASLCLCGGPCVLLTGFGVYQAVSQRDDVQKVLDDTLQAIADNDPDAALEHSSKRAIEHELITREQFEKLAGGPEFKEYQSATITDIKVSASYNSNAAMPQGAVVNVSGTIDYNDGGKGGFEATFEKEGGEWKLYSLRVNRNSAGQSAEKATPEQPATEEN
jgi:hypothetical protein